VTRVGAGWLLGLLAATSACRTDVDPCALEPNEVFFEDRDRDGAGDAASRRITCRSELPEGWVDDPSDCDDLRPSVSPTSSELCDGLDNDCDGQVDDGFPFRDWFLDVDQDGWGALDARVRACSAPPDAVEDPGDCDDADATRHPGAPEVCDTSDNDCDGVIDDLDPDLVLSTATAWHLDLDGDGYGADDEVVLACEAPLYSVQDASDCDDAVFAVNPLGLERCDGIDNDCDGLTDDSDPGIDANTQTLWFADVDGDGLGDPTTGFVTCTIPWYHAQNGADCDDGDARVGDAFTTTWLEDLDGDGVGAGTPGAPGCTPPGPTYVVSLAVGPDCDDGDVLRSPLVLERCNSVDDDCDGLVDDLDPSLDLATAPSWFPDLDGDGHGGPATPSCLPPASTAPAGGDCDDADATVSPAASEVCNGGVDDDCNGFADDADPFADRSGGTLFYADGDGDGFGRPGSGERACALPDGRVDNASDCDDTWVELGPPAAWWRDQDGDGFGTGTPSGPTCAPADPGQALVAAGEDCDDEDPGVNAHQLEQCDDGVDQDCDGEDAHCPRPTCLAWLQDGLSHGDGVYTIDPSGADPVEVWCDMTADGGGWTLVSSSNDPVDDQATGWSPELTSLMPEMITSARSGPARPKFRPCGLRPPNATVGRSLSGPSPQFCSRSGTRAAVGRAPDGRPRRCAGSSVPGARCRYRPGEVAAPRGRRAAPGAARRTARAGRRRCGARPAQWTRRARRSWRRGFARRRTMQAPGPLCRSRLPRVDLERSMHAATICQRTRCLAVSPRRPVSATHGRSVGSSSSFTRRRTRLRRARTAVADRPVRRAISGPVRPSASASSRIARSRGATSSSASPSARAMWARSASASGPSSGDTTSTSTACRAGSFFRPRRIRPQARATIWTTQPSSGPSPRKSGRCTVAETRASCTASRASSSVRQYRRPTESRRSPWHRVKRSRDARSPLRARAASSWGSHTIADMHLPNPVTLCRVDGSSG
jgi:hypothetical protein